MPLVFVLPDDRTAISGGNLYNRSILEALEHSSVEVHALSLAEARDRLGQGMPGLYLVDSLLLREVPKLAAKTASQHIVLLTHYLPSLEPTHASPGTAARERELLRNLDGFVVTSEFMRDQLMDRYDERRPIIVVPPALVVAPSGEELACRRLDAGPFRGLVVANVVPVKGIRSFLEDLATLLSEHDRFTIEIAGRLDLDPVYAEACQRLVARSVPLRGKVRFRGVLGSDAMRKLYLGSNMFISASQMESYGMALHEARAFGLPILAIDAGNVREHVACREQGVLYRSAAELAGGCVALMRDPERLSHLVQTAFESRSADSYSWEDAAELLVTRAKAWIGLHS
jgi:glycosyltransferase involved in cell wall biosynthesis